MNLMCKEDSYKLKVGQKYKVVSINYAKLDCYKNEILRVLLYHGGLIEIHCLSLEDFNRRFIITES